MYHQAWAKKSEDSFNPSGSSGKRLFNSIPLWAHSLRSLFIAPPMCFPLRQIPKRCWLTTRREMPMISAISCWVFSCQAREHMSTSLMVIASGGEGAWPNLLVIAAPSSDLKIAVDPLSVAPAPVPCSCSLRTLRFGGQLSPRYLGLARNSGVVYTAFLAFSVYTNTRFSGGQPHGGAEAAFFEDGGKPAAVGWSPSFQRRQYYRSG